MKKLSFITQFKIEFLLPFTGCRKVLGKKAAINITTKFSANLNLSSATIGISKSFC